MSSTDPANVYTKIISKKCLMYKKISDCECGSKVFKKKGQLTQIIWIVYSLQSTQHINGLSETDFIQIGTFRDSLFSYTITAFH